MVINNTSAVAEIIQAVSPASILGGAASANAREVLTSITNAATPCAMQSRDVFVFMIVPPFQFSTVRGRLLATLGRAVIFRVRRCRSRRYGCGPRDRAP